MKKTVILGAGATYGASIVNQYVKPPLLNDLPKIAESTLVSLNRSKDGPNFAKGFIELLKLTKLEKDIETYLTVLHIIGLISRQINQKFVFMQDNEIRDLLKSDVLQSVFMSSKLESIARIILEYFLNNKAIALMNYPLNFQTFFHNSLREYIYHSLTNCFCIYHEKLFNSLGGDDTVVNFNYDEIADFTLFSTHKLSHQSFNNLPFAKIEFPKEISPNCIPVKYLKVHGSFNWSMDLEKPHVYYNLISEASDNKMIGNTFFPIILPTITKDIIYKQYPIYEKHIYEFSRSLEEPDVIYLVGKSFLNSDAELNNIIKHQREDKTCDLVIIDPCCDKSGFISFHKNLFNAACIRTFLTLEDYYNEQNFS
jgi:hypothetical protein